MPLYQHVLVGKRLLDLFATSDVDAAAGFVKEGAPVNARAAPDRPRRLGQHPHAATGVRRRARPAGRGGRRPVGNGRRVWIPSRVDVLDRLDGAGLLPAIVFIFSRVGCDAAVEQCLRSGIRLTTPEERDEILAFVEEACADLPDEDRARPRLPRLPRRADPRRRRPPRRACCRRSSSASSSCSCAGCARPSSPPRPSPSGINMPARTVVLEKLSKWNGETHADITPGEYTQLTGRAGRRGLDVEGHAVVLWQPGMNPREVAGLASTRTYPLRSCFRPSYNMAVNLVHQVGRARARELLEMSFAQFQADKAVVGLARQLRKSQDALAGVRRGGDLRPRRLHGVRRAPPAGLRAGEGRRPGPAGRPPRGGARSRWRSSTAAT